MNPDPKILTAKTQRTPRSDKEVEEMGCILGGLGVLAVHAFFGLR